MRGGGLGGSSERRACESCGSFSGKAIGDDSKVGEAWRREGGRVGAGINEIWIVLEVLASGDGDSIVQKDAPHSISREAGIRNE